MFSWKKQAPRQLKRVAQALTEETLKKVIQDYENRGWETVGEVRPYRDGFGIMVIYKGAVQQ